MYTLGLDCHAVFPAHIVVVIVMDLYLISVRRVDKHLIVDSLEYARPHCAAPHPVVRILHQRYILWPQDDIDRLICRESLIDTAEVLAHELDIIVAAHSATEDVALADKVCHEWV